jgi:hypothetical protein
VELELVLNSNDERHVLTRQFPFHGSLHVPNLLVVENLLWISLNPHMHRFRVIGVFLIDVLPQSEVMFQMSHSRRNRFRSATMQSAFICKVRSMCMFMILAMGTLASRKFTTHVLMLGRSVLHTGHGPPLEPHREQQARQRWHVSCCSTQSLLRLARRRAASH